MAELTRIDLLLLGLLMDHPMHGYELHQQVKEEGIDRWFNLSLPGIYYSLGKLRDRGLVLEMQRARTGGTIRAVYRVTERGREAFFSRLDAEATSRDRPSLDYDLVVYFLNKLPLSRAEELLAQRSRFLQSWGEELQTHLTEEEAQGTPLLRLALLEHARRYARMEQEWMDCLLRAIRGEPIFAGAPADLMLLSGDLNRYHLPDLIRLIASGRRSGTLTITDGVATRTLTFHEGRPACATSSWQDAEGRESFVQERDQVLAGLYDLFRWQEEDFTFDQTTGPTEGCFLLQMSADQFLLEGCRWVDNWETLQKLETCQILPPRHLSQEQQERATVDKNPKP